MDILQPFPQRTEQIEPQSIRAIRQRSFGRLMNFNEDRIHTGGYRCS